MTVTVEGAARHLCRLSGWRLTNLQLQKILYMADMNFVGQGFGRLVDEDFEAWDYGPVLPSLYHKCKPFGAKRVPDVFWHGEDIEGTTEANMLERAWNSLRSQSPGRLVENTHWSGGAWSKRYVAGSRGIRMTDDDMIDEYHRRRAALRTEVA